MDTTKWYALVTGLLTLDFALYLSSDISFAGQ